ncbi:MAG: DNA repair protein RecO [Spirochaetes bacterium GWD1_61_31]|nr:MAG: DNA repair protein RecO [Spirochaetes bacterium GWB1_60_80]OHD34029.1 MAG: DNA repair protein RecO [Spirochaetes bacterium GWC1_61_12]OHD35204.1 MAG: DNA repair protein RecO [Spirochaetes bacterium GWD1_61_31]OHD41409.1 MAG: DNA repair protein RecO [Spirochaetes bacterium GWE1_60_18]OHD59206.1 MAG: DNA repair protein RecO [Spirochaetes bacterium GWF1_60_12]HAP43093.1 DNA repair protein RecO [Spirochaetaceae bacterium]
MAQRSETIDAVVVHSRESSSGGRLIWLLTPAQGLLQTFLFGGGKSKLRSLASPWHAGRAVLYRDRSDFIKLSDFDPLEEFSHIRASLEAMAVASLVSEVLLATSGLGGDHQAAFSLCLHSLRGLDRAAGAMSRSLTVEAVLLQFSLRVLQQMGLLSDPSACERCSGASGANALHYYSRRHGVFVCARCAEGEAIALPAGAIAWLQRSLEHDFDGALGLGLARESAQAMRACLVDWLAKATGGPLQSLRLLVPA